MSRLFARRLGAFAACTSPEPDDPNGTADAHVPGMTPAARLSEVAGGR
jgi:hypothetical protein